MKLSESVRAFTARWCAVASSNCSKASEAGRYVLCHGCWCVVVVGTVLLVLGIIQKTHIISKSDTPLLEGTGTFFIIIGGSMIVSSPLFALYEYCSLGASQRRRANRTADGNGAQATGTNQEYANDLPTYEEITKNDNLTQVNHSSLYPEMLTVNTLGGGEHEHGLPDYDDIVRGHAKLNTNQSPQVEESEYVATISPSVQIIEGRGDRTTSATCTHHNQLAL